MGPVGIPEKIQSIIVYQSIDDTNRSKDLNTSTLVDKRYFS